jgi:large subunit ribosomal protein L18
MKKNSLAKRALRIRKKLKKVNTDRFRLSVSRSAKNISAQIIDDKNNNTLVSATSVSKKKLNKKKMDLSIFIAETLAKKALEKKITKVYFDRGRHKFHGRIKVFAETLRKNGLNF